MTLIAGAIVEDGVVIRADKRRTTKTSAGGIGHSDDLDKIYVSAAKDTVIYNHGINRINGRDWRTLASLLDAAFASSSPTDVSDALDTAENIIGPDACAEIATNTIDEMTAFVVLFKDATGQWHAGEVSWHRQEGLKKQKLGRAFWSGSGAKRYWQPNASQRTDQHWASVTTDEAQKQLAALYSDAVARQAQANGTEFSPSCQDVTIK